VTCGWLLASRLVRDLAHDPEKCERFSDKIMRKIKDVEHDPFREKRIVL
jgi:hypothetical protein